MLVKACIHIVVPPNLGTIVVPLKLKIIDANEDSH